MLLHLFMFILADPLDRCRTYSISSDDCLNSIYRPNNNYDSYVKSYGMPVSKDKECENAICYMAVDGGSVYIRPQTQQSTNSSMFYNIQSNNQGGSHNMPQAGNCSIICGGGHTNNNNTQCECHPINIQSTAFPPTTRTIQNSSNSNIQPTLSISTISLVSEITKSEVLTQTCTIDRHEDNVTVTRVFTETEIVEKPFTLYRELLTTTTVEVPIINYKVTTITEKSISTKTLETTETSFSTNTVTSTEIETSISIKYSTVTDILTTTSIDTSFITKYSTEISTYTMTEMDTKTSTLLSTITESDTKFETITNISTISPSIIASSIISSVPIISSTIPTSSPILSAVQASTAQQSVNIPSQPVSTFISTSVQITTSVLYMTSTIRETISESCITSEIPIPTIITSKHPIQTTSVLTVTETDYEKIYKTITETDCPIETTPPVESPNPLISKDFLPLINKLLEMKGGTTKTEFITRSPRPKKKTRKTITVTETENATKDDKKTVINTIFAYPKEKACVTTSCEPECPTEC